MKKILIIFPLIQYTVSSFGQTYVGNSADKMNSYNLTIRINQDSSINFIYYRDFMSLYGEYIGRIVKLNDSVYNISATMTIGQSCMKSFNLDTFYIQLYEKTATQLDKMQFAYSDGKTKKQLTLYDSLGNPIRLLKIPVDEKLFNFKKGMDYITITINRKNFLSDSFLSFNIPFGSASIFFFGKHLNFNVIIKNGELYSTGALEQWNNYRPFRLKINHK